MDVNKDFETVSGEAFITEFYVKVRWASESELS